MAAGLHIGRVDLVGRGVDVGLRARPEKEPESVEVVLATRRRVPAGDQTQVHPMHVVLSGEDRKREEGRQFIATLGPGVGESRRHLVPPRAVLASPSRAFGERLEAGRDVPHVGRAAEDDAVGAVECVPILIGDAVDDDHTHVGPGFPCAFGDGVGEYCGVTKARMVRDRQSGSGDMRTIVRHAN